MIYSHLGGMEILNKAFNNFSSRVTVKCDGKEVPLPSLEGLLLLNIPSYGGGVDMWGNREDYLSDSSEPPGTDRKPFALQDKQDGLLELAGVYNSMHLGECQIGLSQALKLAQGSRFEIEIREREELIFQIDGEPCVMKGPAVMEIRRKDQVKILTRTTESYQYVATKAVEVLNWASTQSIINAQQRDIILNEFSKRSKV